MHERRRDRSRAQPGAQLLEPGDGRAEPLPQIVGQRARLLSCERGDLRCQDRRSPIEAAASQQRVGHGQRRSVDLAHRVERPEPLLDGQQVGGLAAEVAQEHPPALRLDPQDLRCPPGKELGEHRGDHRLARPMRVHGLAPGAAAGVRDPQHARVAPARVLPDLGHVGEHLVGSSRPPR